MLGKEDFILKSFVDSQMKFSLLIKLYLRVMLMKTYSIISKFFRKIKNYLIQISILIALFTNWIMELVAWLLELLWQSVHNFSSRLSKFARVIAQWHIPKNVLLVYLIRNLMELRILSKIKLLQSLWSLWIKLWLVNKQN